MKPAHLRVLASAAIVTATALATAPAPAAQGSSCSDADARSGASVRIDRPRPFSRVSGTVTVSGDVQTLPAEPVDQVELYVDGALTATSPAAGSDVGFRFDWDSRSSTGATTLRVVACGPGSYGAATVVVDVDESPGIPIPTIVPLPSSTTTSAAPPSSTTSTTAQGAPLPTSTTIIRPSTTTTTTTPQAVVAPKAKPGEDSLSLRAVQPPSRVRRPASSSYPTPTWPALVTVAGGLVGLTVAIAPGRKWLALVGLGGRSTDDAVIPPERPGGAEQP